MARKALLRKLEVFKLHAHVGGKPPDYGQLFRKLSKLPAEDRTVVDADRLIAIPRLVVSKNHVQLVALEGPVGLTPVIYNVERQTERTQPLQPGDVLVTRTHAVIDLESRRAIVEYNLRGAKASDIAAVLQSSGRRLPAFEGLQLALLAEIGSDFAEALDQFERIKSAKVKLRRPNYDWSDWADRLTDAADESDAQVAHVEFRAARNRSLSKRGGVVAFLKRVATGQAPSPVESASVVGRREEDDADTTISSRGFVRHRRVSIRRAPDGQAVDEEAFEALIEYDDDLQEEGADSTTG
jgi:hypothetical protein